jgi:hypothetical protein
MMRIWRYQEPPELQGPIGDVPDPIGGFLLAENAKTGEGRTVMLVGDLADVIERRHRRGCSPE